MFIRQYFRKEKGRRTAYWALVESYRTVTGPRQRIVAWLGKLDEAGRLGVQQAVEGTQKQTDSSSQEKGPVTLEAFQPLGRQMRFEFDDDASATEPRWVEVTPKSMLKKFEEEILKDDWHSLRDGLEVKIVPWPKDGDDEATTQADARPEKFVLCRSRDRSKKEEAITQKFEKKIEEALTRMKARCEKQHRSAQKVEREIGRMLGEMIQNPESFCGDEYCLRETPASYFVDSPLDAPLNTEY